jgi:hypothetical protein
VNLPYNLEILPGVCTDHKGRKYKLGRYPSGKQVMVPYEEQGAVPVPKEPEPKLKLPKQIKEMGTGKDKTFKPARLHCIRYRWTGQAKVNEVKYFGRSFFNDSLADLKPFSRFDGKNWIPLEPIPSDYHMCWHEDSKDTPQGERS